MPLVTKLQDTVTNSPTVEVISMSVIMPVKTAESVPEVVPEVPSGPERELTSNRLGRHSAPSVIYEDHASAPAAPEAAPDLEAAMPVGTEADRRKSVS